MVDFGMGLLLSVAERFVLLFTSNLGKSLIKGVQTGVCIRVGQHLNRLTLGPQSLLTARVWHAYLLVCLID